MNKDEFEKSFQERQEKLNQYFQEIENYFQQKESYIVQYKHVPMEEILVNAPKYDNLIRLLEQINVFITKNNSWLGDFVVKNNLDFNLLAYERWKSSKDSISHNYSDTESPSKWIHVLQDYFFDILKSLQILLTMEFYIDRDDFRKFLQKYPEVDFRYKANYTKPSVPTDNLDLIFNTIDYLLNLCIEKNFILQMVVPTSLCMQVYRNLDHSGIFDLLKKKEYYVRYYLEYLKMMPVSDRNEIPYEDDIRIIAEDFQEMVSDLFFTYKEYKGRLIEKYEKVKKKVKSH